MRQSSIGSSRTAASDTLPIRDAQPADLARIVAIYNAAIPGHNASIPGRMVTADAEPVAVAARES